MISKVFCNIIDLYLFTYISSEYTSGCKRTPSPSHHSLFPERKTLMQCTVNENKLDLQLYSYAFGGNEGAQDQFKILKGWIK